MQDVDTFMGMAFARRAVFARRHQFVLASEDFIAEPAGIGTALETLVIWQLLQVRQIPEAPLILVGRVWRGLIASALSTMLSTDPPLADPGDMDLTRCVAGAEEAIAAIREHHRLWKQNPC